MAREFNLDDIFSYHEATPEKVVQYQNIRESAKEFAKTVIANSPSCADQTVAIRLIREAVMIANAAIALDGKLYMDEQQS